MKIAGTLFICLLLALSLFAQSGGTVATFALTGDSLITQKISVFDEREFTRLIDAIRKADVAFTNLEMLFHDYEPFPSTESGGTYMRADPAILKDIIWAGFDMVGMANNHTVDYGVEGLRINLRHVKESGLVHAGVGEDLVRARAPGYLDSRIGRVALISCASTFPSFGMAGPARPPVRGRPGLNPLRFTTTYRLDTEGMMSLRAVMSEMGGRRGGQGNTINFLGNRFELADQPGVITAPNEQDLSEITAAIKAAKKQADWVVISVHCHESIPGEREKPPQFLEVFAHAAIEAGADMFAGSGPHVLRGIEIYKGKPIFYSLANFIFENETLDFFPAENYLPLGLGPDATPADFNDRRYRNDTTGFPADEKIWQSVVAFPSFRAGIVEKIELWPIVLGQKKPRSQRGRPVLAEGPAALQILQHLSDLSAPYGTKIAIRNDRGTILP
ncbi:MAG: CapA family protein [Acidobacteriia bacterium]|nr:CapA family protein [Terriglobia bacterium]